MIVRLTVLFENRFFHSIFADTPITAWSDNKGLNQAWLIQPISPGSDTYTIRNVAAGTYMDLSTGVHLFSLVPFLPIHAPQLQVLPTMVPRSLGSTKTEGLINNGQFASQDLILGISKSFGSPRPLR